MDQKFKALQKQWYKKLAQTGFRDIEDGNGNLRNLSTKLTSVDPGHAGMTQEYYEAARALMHTNYLKDIKTKIVWGQHSEGSTIESISKKTGLSLFKVAAIIHETEQRYILPKRPKQ